jgi:hypothetical protein
MKNSFKKTSIIRNPKGRAVTVIEQLGRSKTNRASLNKSGNSEGKITNHSNIKINYFHIKNNIDKYFYSNGHTRNEKDPNPQNEAILFIDKLNQRTTERLKKLLDKKSNYFNKIRNQKTSKLSTHLSRRSIAFKNRRSVYSNIKTLSKRESNKSKTLSKNSNSNHPSSQKVNENCGIKKETKVKFVSSLNSNNSIISKIQKKNKGNIHNCELKLNKNESNAQDIYLNESNNLSKGSIMNEDMIFKKLNNKMNEFLKLINSCEDSVSNKSSSSD